MKISAFIIALALALAIGSKPGGVAKAAESGSAILPGNPLEGSQLFAEKGCLRCHAINGVGGVGGRGSSRRLGGALGQRLPDFCEARIVVQAGEVGVVVECLRRVEAERFRKQFRTGRQVSLSTQGRLRSETHDPRLSSEA